MGELDIPVSGFVFTVGMSHFGPVEPFICTFIIGAVAAATPAVLADMTEIFSTGEHVQIYLYDIHCFFMSIRSTVC